MGGGRLCTNHSLTDGRAVVPDGPFVHIYLGTLDQHDRTRGLRLVDGARPATSHPSMADHQGPEIVVIGIVRDDPHRGLRDLVGGCGGPQNRKDSPELPLLRPLLHTEVVFLAERLAGSGTRDLHADRGDAGAGNLRLHPALLDRLVKVYGLDGLGAQHQAGAEQRD